MAATEPADFHQPQVQNRYGCCFATGRFEDLTFCKPDVSDVLKPVVLKPDVLKPDVLKPNVLWVYLSNTGDSVPFEKGNFIHFCWLPDECTV